MPRIAASLAAMTSGSALCFGPVAATERLHRGMRLFMRNRGVGEQIGAAVPAQIRFT